MDINFRYGRETMTITINEANVAGVIGNTMTGVIDPGAEIRRALNQPIASPRLQEIIDRQKPARVVIVVTDVSRPIPYRDLLPALLNVIHETGLGPEQVSFVIATGAHRPNTDEENQEVFGNLVRQYNFSNHDCDNDLAFLGHLSNGTELWINRQVANADMVITIGAIMPHNLAGFSGGPKLILPGVAGRRTIEENHRMMNQAGVGPGQLSDNPIQQQMLEAARMVGVDFVLNVVLDWHNGISRAFAGHPEAAWRAGCQYARHIYEQPLPDKAEVVIAGAGGYPRDANLYQAVKALVNAGRMVKSGGTVVLLAKCQQGMGDPQFARWMDGVQEPEEVLARFRRQGFILGGHKAYVLCKQLKDKEVVMISHLDQAQQRLAVFRHAADWPTAENYLKKKHGVNYRALILPQAGLVFPLSH